MSRIGKLPIPIPKGVTVTINANEVTVKGPKGELKDTFHADMIVSQEDGQIIIERPTESNRHRSLHGLTRALINNMVVGVSEGFTRELNITGVGYRAEMQGTDLVLHVGYSHPVVVKASPTLTFDVPKDSRGTLIRIEGINKQEVGQRAAEIRKTRLPEPYKGKGITYAGEIIRRKAGKSAKK
ncbi:MAG: 50S ribosomal protein L6 [Chloroflexi bacterium]|nr:50S ribosomal protein L6 [Chloroflexota bacterium]